MKSSTQWVTIPEEKIHTPVSNPEKRPGTKPQTKALAVRHKFFWSVGFVAVVIMSFAMLAPQQFGSIIQGNLFDAPGVEAPDLAQAIRPIDVLPNAVEPVTDSTQEASIPAPLVTESNVVQPETTAVDVQVTPVTPLEPVEPADRAPAQSNDLLAQELEANKKLIEELQKQVETMQQGAFQGLTPQAFMPPVVSQFLPTVNLRPSAPEAAEVTANLGQTAIGGPYKVNTHKSPFDPRTVLEQNRAAGRYVIRAPAPLSAAGVPYYQADLSRVKGTPDSGPREVITVALLMTFALVVGWKAYKLFRA